MAKPKKFTADEFQRCLNNEIDTLIADKKNKVDSEASDILVEELAQVFKVNVATLRRWCNEHCRKSPGRYVAEYRIEKAITLLVKGLKPSTVTRALAFTEHKTFCTVFKRYKGISPSKFMKNRKIEK